MRSKTTSPQEYLFPDKLKNQLCQIMKYPLTIVEAPSGFGKTTAIKEYLRSEQAQSVSEWYTCLGESATFAWLNICELFSIVDGKIAEEMKNLKVPTVDTMFYIREYLKVLKCTKKTYLVIDNYHLIKFTIHRDLINLFSMHNDPNLHIIFITQQLDCGQRPNVHNNNIFTIDASFFYFDKEGIASLFRMERLRLNEHELDNVYKNTEGWISAIRLQIINYKKTGSFICSAGIEQLVETAVWNRLMEVEKDFLLRVSVFDSFTAQQVAAMLDYESTVGEIEVRLKSGDFIRFLPDKRIFVIHSIILDFLRNQFYYHYTKDYQARIFYKAAKVCAELKQYYLATKFFYKIKNFAGILSLPFTHQYLESQKEEYGELYMEFIRECPDDILSMHPSVIFLFGHYALTNEQFGIYLRLCKLLRLKIEKNIDMSQEELRKITGKLVLLETMGEFNDLSKMRDGYLKAGQIFGESSDLIDNSMPWPPVFLTAIGMFWRESGKLEQMLTHFDEIKPFYNKYSRGQGAGLGNLMSAEVLLLHGNDNEAEIYCYKALYEARAYQQTTICIHAELNLAQIFILRGDTENFFAIIKNMQSYVQEHADVSIRRMVDLSMSIISLLLGNKEYVASWLYNIESIRKVLYAPIIPFAEILYCKLLLIDKRYNELYAVGQLAIEAYQNPDANKQYMLQQLYQLIFFELQKHSSANEEEDQAYMKDALNIAIPDRVFLPFASYESMADILRPFCGLDGIADLLELCNRQQKGIKTIRKAWFQHKSSLTPREREVALLAKERMSAKEIAEMLYITEATVKSTLRSIYSKLEIHSKNELLVKEF